MRLSDSGKDIFRLYFYSYFTRVHKEMHVFKIISNCVGLIYLVCTLKKQNKGKTKKYAEKGNEKRKTAFYVFLSHTEIVHGSVFSLLTQREPKVKTSLAHHSVSGHPLQSLAEIAGTSRLSATGLNKGCFLAHYRDVALDP